MGFGWVREPRASRGVLLAWCWSLALGLMFAAQTGGWGWVWWGGLLTLIAALTIYARRWPTPATALAATANAVALFFVQDMVWESTFPLLGFPLALVFGATFGWASGRPREDQRGLWHEAFLVDGVLLSEPMGVGVLFALAGFAGGRSLARRARGEDARPGQLP